MSHDIRKLFINLIVEGMHKRRFRNLRAFATDARISPTRASEFMRSDFFLDADEGSHGRGSKIVRGFAQSVNTMLIWAEKK